MTVQTEKAPNKHQLRTMETRELLLRAAEKIFVRDGYEMADLGEIAELAGRTKGAIYAHFKSKEEIFLALIEERGVRGRARMEELLARSTSVEQNQEAMRQFFIELAEDRSWALLLLEFKLFSIRHPEAKKRLQKYFHRMMPPSQDNRYTQILGQDKRKDALSRRVAVQMLQPIVSALVLEVRFDQSLDAEEILTKVARKLYDALI